MSSVTRPSRFTRVRRRTSRPGTVHRARWAWVRRHPGRSALVLAALLTALGFAIPAGYSLAFPPVLNCGPGMVIAGSPPACIGVSLGFEPFTANDPARMRALERQVQSIDDKVRGPYVSVVLLLNLSPVRGTDTVTYPALYPNIEGAITAVWQANNTSAFYRTPKVKLYLGNMGSQYGSWRKAAAQIEASRTAQHITDVAGLEQSTRQTRRAAAQLSARANLPVIGATVTGDTMNIDPVTHRRIATFFRVSPPNSAEVRGIAHYIRGLHLKSPSAAIVEDTPGDDYESTLAAVAPGALRAAGLKVDEPLPYVSGGKPDGETRETYLGNQFNRMQSNLCQLDPSLVFFAGRGQDLDAFVRSWVDEKGCQQDGAPPLHIFSGDDASAVVTDRAVRRAIGHGQVTLTYTTLASVGMWGVACTGAKANFDQFLAAFTGQDAPCGAQATGGSPRFSPADLDSGQAVPTHDAVIAAVMAAREAQGSTPLQDQLEAVANPESQLAFLRGFTCTTMLGGAGGYVSFGSDGSPVDRPVPVVSLNGDGSVTFDDLTWPVGGPKENLPAAGAGC